MPHNFKRSPPYKYRTFSGDCPLGLAKMFYTRAQKTSFNGQYFCFKLQTVGVDSSTQLKSIWWFSSNTRHCTAGTGPDQSCLDSLWGCSKLTYLLSRRKTCLMWDHWCLPGSVSLQKIARKWLKWVWWENNRKIHLFQGRNPENIRADWENWSFACYSIFIR